MTVVKWIGVGSLAVTPDYTTINAWDSYLNALGTFTEDQVGRVLWASSANELALASGQTLDGSTPSTFNIILESGDTNGNAGGSFRDNANKTTNALRYNADNGACILINSGTVTGLILSDPNITVRYLQIKKTSAYQGIVQATTADTGKVLDSCIFQYHYGTGTSAIEVRDCIAKNLLILISLSNSGAVACFEVLTGAGTSELLNSTLACTNQARRGIWKDYAGSILTVKNVSFFGNDVDWYSNTSNVTCTNCATDFSSGTSTLPGSAHQYDLIGATEWESVTNGSEDFRLKSGSVKCKDNGTSSGAPTIDIIGQARS